MAVWHPHSFSGEQLCLSSSLLAGGSSALFTGPRGMRGLPGVEGCGVGEKGVTVLLMPPVHLHLGFGSPAELGWQVARV